MHYIQICRVDPHLTYSFVAVHATFSMQAGIEACIAMESFSIVSADEEFKPQFSVCFCFALLFIPHSLILNRLNHYNPENETRTLPARGSYYTITLASDASLSTCTAPIARRPHPHDAAAARSE